MDIFLPQSNTRKIILTVCFFLAGLYVQAQQWTNAVGIGSSAGSETGRGSCTDANGNVYYIGTFATTVNFNPALPAVNLVAAGVTDVFVTKYNDAGVFQWAVRCGGEGPDQGLGITTDGTNVFITGVYNTSVTLNPATFGSLTLTTNGTGSDLFVASLNASNGSFNWAKSFGAPNTGGDNGQAVCLDGTGGLYVSGTFLGSATFGTTTLTATGASSTSDMFVAKLNASNGDVAWAVGGGSSNDGDNGLGSSICYHPGLDEIIFGGCYNGASATYGGFTLSNSGLNDLVLLEINAATGAIVQAHGFGGNTSQDDAITGVCYDPLTQDIFFTGFFNGNITFTGNPVLNSAGSHDYFVGRYAPSTNNFPWTFRGGSTGDDRSYSICSNGSGAVYITGYYSAAYLFGAVNLPAPAGLADAFVGGVAVADGAMQWAIRGAGTDAGRNTQGRALSEGGPKGKIAVCGQYGGTGTFGAFSFSVAGNVDIFLAQLGAAITATVTGTNPSCENGCDGNATVLVSGGVAPFTYSWSPSGGNAASASNLCAGSYTVTVTDALSQSKMASTTLNLPTGSIANEEAENPSFIVSPSNTVIANSACRVIAKVVPNGGSPIAGATSAFVKFAPTVPVYPAVTGQPFVQRRYQITPASGAADATGRVTLYFRQAEFDAFNLHPKATLKLPMNSADATGKANVRIGKYPGTSSDGSGLPGTYTGTPELINPDDVDIIFNVTEDRWEISFNVTGFSGFLLQTSVTVLPVRWITVTALPDAAGRTQLKWEVEESNVLHYAVERSVNGSDYTAIASVNSKGDGKNGYLYTDAGINEGRVYYRIRQTDIDGKKTYSQVLIMNNRNGGPVTAYPNPTSGTFILNITDRSLMNTVARLYSSDGRELEQVYIRQTATAVSLERYVKGAYFLKLQNGETIRVLRK